LRIDDREDLGDRTPDYVDRRSADQVRRHRVDEPNDALHVRGDHAFADPAQHGAEPTLVAELVTQQHGGRAARAIACDRLAREQGLAAIAVGIDHGGERRNTELSPWDHERIGKGEGFAYLRFLVETVKPYVDARWRTRPESASTALIGSSLGGLVTHAALHRHREVFGLGGVLSPAFWVNEPRARMLAESEPLLAHQRLVLYGGGREDRDMLPMARRMAELLRRQSRHLLYIEEPAAGHNEAAWRAVLPRVLAHLFGDAG